MAKKIRRQDESKRAAGESERGSEGVTDTPSGSEDEKAEESSVRDGGFDEKKTASPGPSGA